MEDEANDKEAVPGAPATQTVCVNLVGTFGLSCVSYWWTRVAACGLRLTYHLFPFKWAGFRVEWLGMETEYPTYKLGRSALRGSVLWQGVGRLAFASTCAGWGPDWKRPFLGPLHAWSSAVQGKAGALISIDWQKCWLEEHGRRFCLYKTRKDKGKTKGHRRGSARALRSQRKKALESILSNATPDVHVFSAIKSANTVPPQMQQQPRWEPTRP